MNRSHKIICHVFGDAEELRGNVGYLSWLFICLINRIRHRCLNIGTGIVTVRAVTELDSFQFSDNDVLLDSNNIKLCSYRETADLVQSGL